MRPNRSIGLLLVLLCAGAVAVVYGGQTPRRPRAKPTPQAQKPAQPAPPPATPGAEPAIETVKVDTNLVTVPVVVTDADAKNVAKLRQEDFIVAEDGKPQQIALFATTRLPVSVVLLIDTSASTRDKLTVIQAAAIAFVEKLEPGDHVKVISFDSHVSELSPFSNDRAVLRAAINKTAPGQGTKLYDAVELALAKLRKLDGRKAIVMFTDGVDWRSDEASDYTTLRYLDEEGVTFYPIRYDTRAMSEAILRNADEDSPRLPTIDVIRKGEGGSTEPTFPTDDPDEQPPAAPPPATGPLGLPRARDILRGSRRREPGDPSPVPPTTPAPPTPGAGKKAEPKGERRGRHGKDPVNEMLDRMYSVADKYLNDLANNSGGIVLRVDDLATLPDAFAQVAAELQLQYVLGYYPTNKSHDGEYRNISITIPNRQLTIRARPGYRAP
ncbi:MAG TPA: VWA domain-containing protein [Pyrinomonadaceae bacterium]|nr:VWA domain-containing protein [Pyrinomonadaceae bacterium]